MRTNLILCSAFSLENTVFARVNLENELEPRPDAHEFLRKRMRRGNKWYNPLEEVFEGNLEQECIEESCDFYEMNEIDDDWVTSRQKWDYYRHCHLKINNGRKCGEKQYKCKDRLRECFSHYEVRNCFFKHNLWEFHKNCSPKRFRRKNHNSNF